MATFIWDAGVIIGYVIWVGEEHKSVTSKIEPLAENCHRFVHYHGKKAQNFIPTNSQQEVTHRLKRNITTFGTLVDYLRRGRFTLQEGVDLDRFENIKLKLASVDKKQAMKTLLEVQSLIHLKIHEVKTICNLIPYTGRLDKKMEDILRPKFQKNGDLLNFSAAIHFHNNHSECIFITTDRADFGNLDLTKTDIKLKVPSINFIQNY